MKFLVLLTSNLFFFTVYLLNTYTMKILTFLLTVFLSLHLSAQCPQTANTSANGCLYLVWTTPPSPLPTIVGYTYDSGAGTSGSPAVYKPGGGCGANKGGFNGSFTISGGPTCTYVNGILPVKFYDFSAVMYDHQCLIKFTTASEINNDYFEIERSADGQNFKMLTSISGAGNSNDLVAYDWSDKDPLLGYNYYRIKQTDFDGKSTYSNIVSTRNNAEEGFALQPTVITNQLQIMTAAQNFDVKIITSEGSIVMQSHQLSGVQNIDTAHLPSGLYIVTIYFRSTVQTFKILKHSW